MPLTISRTDAAGTYTSPFVGRIDHTGTVRVDVSALTNTTVDTRGYLKPGVVFRSDGTLPGGATAGLTRQTIISGGAAGNHTVTGIATTDTLVSVIRFDVEADTGTDATGNKVGDVTVLTSEFTISAANTINNTGGTNTSGDKLQVTYTRAGTSEAAFGVVIEPVKVAATNDSDDLTAATDIDVAVATICQVNQDIAEDNLGRAYTAAELAAIAASGSIKLLQ